MRSKIHTQKFADLFKYYRLRAGFSSLRELSEEMADKGQYYDPSFYSHIQNGSRVPTRKTLLTLLKLFAERKALNNVQEINSLLTSTNQGYLTEEEALSFVKVSEESNTSGFMSIFGSFNKVSFCDTIDLLKLNYTNVKAVRESVQLHLAMKMAHDTIAWIDKCKVGIKNEEHKKALLFAEGDLLYEKAYLSGCIFQANENMHRIRTIVQKQTQLAKEYKNTDLYVKAFIPLAFNYYAQAQHLGNSYSKKLYRRSIDLMQKALQYCRTNDVEKLICMRTIAVNCIYLSDIDLFYQTEKTIRRFILENEDMHQNSYIVWALDTIARGKAHFGDSSALAVLQENKQYEQALPWRDPFRETSMIRNEIEILTYLKTNSESNYIIKLSKKGYKIADENKIFRYKIFFEKYI